MIIKRPFWINRIEHAWTQSSLVWLAGVRRVGKTTLVQSLTPEQVKYINCDLPIVAEMVDDPELFYRNCDRPILVFDEIHQLSDPSRLLKIGADLFPKIKIIATGSSTLAASGKFRDTLTGRKRHVHLTPVLWNEIQAFQNVGIFQRLFRGGLPQALLAEKKDNGFYREWIDSFFVRDIQKLFSFRTPEKFMALFEYIMKQSGGLFETTKAASALGISRPTIENHLKALEITQAVSILRPFFGGGQKELTRMSKVYGFDTGFVSFCRGWDPLRTNDYGILWEHLVLEYVVAHQSDWAVQYWRDGSGREIDFVIARNREEIDVIECKWEPQHFEATSLKVFRQHYPKGHNYLICPIGSEGYEKEIAGHLIRICNPDGWWQHSQTGK